MQHAAVRAPPPRLCKSAVVSCRRGKRDRDFLLLLLLCVLHLVEFRAGYLSMAAGTPRRAYSGARVFKALRLRVAGLVASGLCLSCIRMFATRYAVAASRWSAARAGRCCCLNCGTISTIPTITRGVACHDKWCYTITRLRGGDGNDVRE